MAQLASDAAILKQHPIPYAPILWIIEHSRENDFLGNPVRHFQHLASRMNWKQPQPELRIARAWICLHLCELSFGTQLYPRDFRQIEKESLHIPTKEGALNLLTKHSPHPTEIQQVRKLLEQSQTY